MAIFYLLHEYVEKYHPDYPLGKKFARTVILGFIAYYLLYFCLPLAIPNGSKRIKHFIKYLIVVDIMSSSIFYGGLLNGISFFSTGKQLISQNSTSFVPKSISETKDSRPKESVVSQNRETLKDISSESKIRLNE